VLRTGGQERTEEVADAGRHQDPAVRRRESAAAALPPDTKQKGRRPKWGKGVPRTAERPVLIGRTLRGAVGCDLTVGGSLAADGPNLAQEGAER